MTENLFEKDSRGHKNDRESFEKRFSDVIFSFCFLALETLLHIKIFPHSHTLAL